MGYILDSIKALFTKNTTNAASVSGARVPIMSADGTPIGNDSMANLASVLGVRQDILLQNGQSVSLSGGIVFYGHQSSGYGISYVSLTALTHLSGKTFEECSLAVTFNYNKATITRKGTSGGTTLRLNFMCYVA